VYEVEALTADVLVKRPPAPPPPPPLIPPPLPPPATTRYSPVGVGFVNVFIALH
jgi:hypothetical protein